MATSSLLAVLELVRLAHGAPGPSAAGPARAQAAPVAPRQPSQVDLARQRFLRGVSLYETGAYGAALREFEASVALYASPNAHLYTAHCLKALGRLPEAVAAYERTVGLARDRAAADPRYGATAAAAHEELRVLLAQVGRVKLDGPALPAGARLTVADRELPPAAIGLAIPVRPGLVRVAVSAPGHADVAQVARVEAGQTVVVELRLVPLPAPPAASPPARLGPSAVASFAVAGAGLASAGLFYGLARREYDGLARRCAALPCPGEERDAIARGRRHQLVTNLSLAAAAVGAITGIALFAWPTRGADEARVALGTDGRGLVLSGAF